MVDIVSKRDGPRREDAEIGRFLKQNRTIITKLADQISNGQYSRSKRPEPVLQPEGLIIHIGDRPAAEPELQPQIRVTANGRVVAVDIGSSRQLAHFGDIRKTGPVRTFVLASAANGYVAPLDDEALDVLADIDGVAIGASYDTGELAADIGRRLDIPWEA
jgi:hypothetical protein